MNNSSEIQNNKYVLELDNIYIPSTDTTASLYPSGYISKADRDGNGPIREAFTTSSRGIIDFLINNPDTESVDNIPDNTLKPESLLGYEGTAIINI